MASLRMMRCGVGKVEELEGHALPYEVTPWDVRSSSMRRASRGRGAEAGMRRGRVLGL